MMKLTVFVLLGLIGVAIALHGTGAYGNTGGYGNNGGGGHKHHKSSESEEFVRPKVCSLACTNDAKYKASLNGATTELECDVFNTNSDGCWGCCEGWALSRGLTTIEYTSTLTTAPNKCVCCQRKCT